MVVLGLSRLVTSWPLKVGLVLQIEIFDSGVFCLSRSVTGRPLFAEYLLQIEIKGSY